MTIFDTMSVGEVIAALEQAPCNGPVKFDFCGCVPCGISSYRGYYDHLCLHWFDPADYNQSQKKEAWTIETLQDSLEDVATKQPTFYGYKGGNFRMDAETPLWVDNWGNATQTAIIEVKVDVSFGLDDENEKGSYATIFTKGSNK